MSESVYIHGTAADEQRRLSLLNDVLLNNASLRKMKADGTIDKILANWGLK